MNLCGVYDKVWGCRHTQLPASSAGAGSRLSSWRVVEEIEVLHA